VKPLEALWAFAGGPCGSDAEAGVSVERELGAMKDLVGERIANRETNREIIGNSRGLIVEA